MANTVLITGASQGTGKATALLFARHGYEIGGNCGATTDGN